MRHDLISYERARTIYTESWQLVSSGTYANDTPALNAHTALRGAPTSMGRGEIPVELMPSAVRSVHFFRYGKGELSLKKDNLLRYSMQLAFLKQLLEKKLISDREYSLIKSRLMKDYKIVSDLLS